MYIIYVYMYIIYVYIIAIQNHLRFARINLELAAHCTLLPLTMKFGATREYATNNECMLDSLTHKWRKQMSSVSLNKPFL